ncbi:MAG: acyltransferase [Planctomycetales bacterium]|nr:acyltransferase [Planctomycetales bacterium]
MIARNSAFVCKDGSLSIGDRAGIGTNSLFHAIGDSRVAIGNDVAIGSYCYLIGGGEYVTDSIDLPVMHQGQVSRGGITIEDNVWIGARVTVLDGVTIGRNSIVGAGSVVNSDIAPFSVAVGSPARVIRDRREGGMK